MMECLSENHPDWNGSEWIDDQAGLLMKWAVPVLGATRAEWISEVSPILDALIIQTPGRLDSRTQSALDNFANAVLVVGRADLLDEAIRQNLGFQVIGQRVEGDFYVCNGDAQTTPVYDRPYLPEHQPILVQDGTRVHYQTVQTPLITACSNWLYWQPPDWSEPFNPFLPKYQLGSTFPHFLVAALLHESARENGLSYADSIEHPYPIALHLWRSGGHANVLVGNLESGEFGDSRTPRHARIFLSRSQLALSQDNYCLRRADSPTNSLIVMKSVDSLWLSCTIDLPPEQSAVFVVVEANRDQD
jgi:hypothetical protein